MPLNILIDASYMIFPLIGAYLPYITYNCVDSKHNKWTDGFTFCSTILILLLSLFNISKLWFYSARLYSSAFYTDCLTQFGGIFVLLTTIFIVCQLWDYIHKVDRLTIAYIPLLLILATNAIVVLSTTNLLVLTIALSTILLIVNKIITISTQQTKQSHITYLIIEIFATSIFFLVSIFLYKITTSFDIAKIGSYLVQNKPSELLKMAIILLTLSFCLKLSILPLYYWLPTLYELVPHSIATFIYLINSGAITIAFIRIVTMNLSQLVIWPPIKEALIIIIGASLLISSWSILIQTNIKKLLAYLSIANINFIMFGVVLGTADSCISSIMQLIAYPAAMMVIVGGLINLDLAGNQITFYQIQDLGKKHPVLRVIISISIIAVSGLPGTFVFYNKCVTLKEMIVTHYTMVTVSILSSTALIYLCYKTLVTLFTQNESFAASSLPTKQSKKLSVLTDVTLIICSIITIITSILPETAYNSSIIHHIGLMLQNEVENKTNY